MSSITMDLLQAFSPESPQEHHKKTQKRKKGRRDDVEEVAITIAPRKRAKTDDERKQRQWQRVNRNRQAAADSRNRTKLQQEAAEGQRDQLQEILKEILKDPSAISKYDIENDPLFNDRFERSYMSEKQLKQAQDERYDDISAEFSSFTPVKPTQYMPRVQSFQSVSSNSDQTSPETMASSTFSSPLVSQESPITPPLDRVEEFNTQSAALGAYLIGQQVVLSTLLQVWVEYQGLTRNKCRMTQPCSPLNNHQYPSLIS
jgi:hypothetical protein